MALLELQKLFQGLCLVDGKLKKMIYLDKGYRVARETPAHNQKFAQPVCAKKIVDFPTKMDFVLQK